MIAIFLFCSSICGAQIDSSKWVRAFPVTDYFVELTDSITLVQLYLPNGPVLKEKQVGILKGVYSSSHADTSTIGTGRCHLIKGDFYYFSIHHNNRGRRPKQHDLLYLITEKPPVHIERIAKIASHHIVLQNVYGEPLFDRDHVFQKWDAGNESSCIDSMRNDIRFTGDYFLKNEPSVNVKIAGGKYTGEMVLTVMTKCSHTDVKDFLDYVIVRPQLYAGKEWKVSEIFATWLSSGAPAVVQK